MTSSTEIQNTSSTNVSGQHDNWFEHDFGGYPIVYPITIYYLYPIIIFGRIVHVLWYVIGCIGNVICMKIWSIPQMKRLNSSALYLLFITICDIAYQVLHVFYYLKYFWGLSALGFPVLCEVWNVLNLIPQYASQFLVLGFTIEKFISIFRPFHSERFSRRQRAPRKITTVMICAVMLSLPQAYFWKVDENGFCELRQGNEAGNFYTIWSFVTETIAFLVVPALTLFLNIFVLRETRKVLKEHTRSNLNSEDDCETRIHHHKGKTYRPSTITLLSISCFRIFTQLPVSITYTMQNIAAFNFGKVMALEAMQYDSQWRSFLTYWGTRMIIELIGASHHALSIFIFYGSTKQFRAEFRRLFLGAKSCLMKPAREQIQMKQKKEGNYRVSDSISRTQSVTANSSSKTNTNIACDDPSVCNQPDVLNVVTEM